MCRRSRVARLGMLPLLSVLSACGLDDRLLVRDGGVASDGAGLSPAEQEHDGAADGGGLPVDGSAPGPVGSAHDAGPPGAGGDGASPHPFDAGDCADRDHDGTPDCDESLAKNATFDSDTTDWQAEGALTLLWSNDDVRGAVHSGSMVVENGDQGSATAFSFSGSTQCIRIVAGTSYRLAASAFIPSGQELGGAGLSARSFPTADCTGAPSSQVDGPPTDKVATWTAIRAEMAAPAAAQSMLVRLVVLKPLDESSFEVRFDRVRVTSE